ncbi:FAD/NAD(P)-binding protein [Ornithinimicrobium humiphilum]|uniref:FAD-NAD(P)-binding protein n=1 Tax=Ornithinimicrobium humiphilum TaxID=125288 RepID=A0A543KL52_9MICO|nr:FAD/NAD(P)-binding protein [Ornithinimicrobium humiphilum]TQM95816.1 FAD-NAD(P)-binding protein [Ornithinimicrobium humiphilum]
MTARFDAVVVGGGPRGVATVLRTAARSGDAPLHLAVVDALEVGAGATWLTSQPAAYLNNTQARATTVHPDDSTRMSGPPAPGPDLVAWAAEVAAAGEHPFADWVVQEATELRPDDFPTRRLQGVYFRDQLDAAVRSGRVRVTPVLGRVVDLQHEVVDGDELGTGDLLVLLEGGDRLAAPTVVLAQGMVQARRSAEVAGLVAEAERLGLRYVEPGMPAERDFTGLPAGEDVLVRGLGATFFDVVGQLVDEWGGHFEPVPGDPHGRLTYVRGGAEPRLVVGSRRGLPYRSKPDGGRPVRTFEPRWATPEWFAGLTAHGGLDFATDVWPTVAAELARAYLEALEGYAVGAVRPGWLAALDEAEDLAAVEQVLADAILDPRWTWQVDHLRRPTGGRVVDEQEWATLVRRLVDDELGSMSEAAVHPRAAVNAAMGALRGHVGRAGVRGAFSGTSLVRDVHGWFDGDGLFLASGPPSHRVRQVLALVEAGVIDLLGPGFTVAVHPERRVFRAWSSVTGRSAVSRVLLETRMSKGKVPDTDDPLLRSLLDSGRARIHRVDGAATASLEATGAELDEAVTVGHNLVAADGTVDEAVVVLGIPAQSTQPGSAIGASPGVPSPLLAGADVAAKQVVARSRRRAAERATALVGAGQNFRSEKVRVG